MFLQYVGRYLFADHPGNARTGEAAFYLYSFQDLSGPANIAGAVDVSTGKKGGRRHIMRIERQSMGEFVFSVTPTAKYKVGVADLRSIRRIAWIQLCCPVKFGKRAFPLTAAAIDCSSVVVAKRTVRLQFEKPVEFLQSSIVVTMAPVMKHRQCQMRVRRSRSDR